MRFINRNSNREPVDVGIDGWLAYKNLIDEAKLVLQYDPPRPLTYWELFRGDVQTRRGIGYWFGSLGSISVGAYLQRYELLLVGLFLLFTYLRSFYCVRKLLRTSKEEILAISPGDDSQEYDHWRLITTKSAEGRAIDVSLDMPRVNELLESGNTVEVLAFPTCFDEYYRAYAFRSIGNKLVENAVVPGEPHT